MRVARILTTHFADPDAVPSGLTGRFHRVHVPAHYGEHIAAVARRSGERARQTGQWLVRYGTEQDDVLVGLGLLAAVGTDRDIPRIQTIGLLSDTFASLAATALQRLPGGAEALVWLADRVHGWGRVYVVETLCDMVCDHPVVRSWLLRRAADWDFLNGYFAYRVAKAADLHKAMTDGVADAEMVDQAGRLLHTMTHCSGMGGTLDGYQHAFAVLDAHRAAIARLGPSPERFVTAAMLAWNLGSTDNFYSIGPPEHWTRHRDAYLQLLDNDTWVHTARNALAAGDKDLLWRAEVMKELGLRAFTPRP